MVGILELAWRHGSMNHDRVEMMDDGRLTAGLSILCNGNDKTVRLSYLFILVVWWDLDVDSTNKSDMVNELLHPSLPMRHPSSYPSVTYSIHRTWAASFLAAFADLNSTTMTRPPSSSVLALDIPERGCTRAFSFRLA